MQTKFVLCPFSKPAKSLTAPGRGSRFVLGRRDPSSTVVGQHLQLFFGASTARALGDSQIGTPRVARRSAYRTDVAFTALQPSWTAMQEDFVGLTSFKGLCVNCPLRACLSQVALGWPRGVGPQRRPLLDVLTVPGAADWLPSLQTSS